jgi:hypothetical protein
MIDTNHPNAHLIEMNARPTYTMHLGQLFGHDIVGALLAQLRGECPSSTVASLPLECARRCFPTTLSVIRSISNGFLRGISCKSTAG